MKNSKFFFNQLVGFILIAVHITPIFSSNSIPVFFWGGSVSGKLDYNVFEEISRDEFNKYVSELLGNSQPPIVVFVKKNFCTEDLSRHSNSLASLEKYHYEYMPAVESPLSQLKKLPYYNQSEVEELESVGEGQLVVIEVTDMDSIPDIFESIKKSSPPHLIGVLTGNSCSYYLHRGKREVLTDAAENKSKPFVIDTARLLLYADTSPTIEFGGFPPINLTDKTNVSESGDATSSSPLMVKIDFKVQNESTVMDVVLGIEISSNFRGYYSIDQIFYNITRGDELIGGNLSVLSPIYWSEDFSYHCGNLKFTNKNKIKNENENENKNENKTVELTFKNLQVQLDTKKKGKFSDAYDCVGFTTIPIWSAMFVTSIFTIIVFWGILMVMDIRTMDRFDDPKGKTISISVTE